MKLFSINIVNFKVDGGAMFGVVPKLLWSRIIKADNDNLIPLSLRSLIIKTDDKCILIDVGIGEKQGKKFNKHLYRFGGEGLINGLHNKGLTETDVTDVILTHLHFDHCGGAIEFDQQKKPYAVFPRAKYWVSRDQWLNAMNPNPREEDAYLPENLLPMQELGILNFIEKDQLFCKDVELRIVDGHTPGQLIPVIHYGDRRLVYGADLFPTRAHIPIKYNMAYDLDVTKTMEEKRTFLEEFCTPQSAILFEHDVDCELGIIQKSDKGYKLVNCLTLDQWINEY